MPWLDTKNVLTYDFGKKKSRKIYSLKPLEVKFNYYHWWKIFLVFNNNACTGSYFISFNHVKFLLNRWASQCISNCSCFVILVVTGGPGTSYSRVWCATGHSFFRQDWSRQVTNKWCSIRNNVIFPEHPDVSTLFLFNWMWSTSRRC